MDAIVEQFITEARDNLEYLDRHLENIKDSDEETINALFRAAHTLKGGAGLVGFEAVKEITHAAEDLLDAYRNGKIDFTDEIIEILYDAFDEVVELIDAVEELGTIDIDVDRERIEELKNNIRSFLTESSDSGKEGENKKIELKINLNQELNVELFKKEQLKRVIPTLPLRTPEVSKEFVEQESWYLLNLDLDIETIRLGNDIVYLFYLLETDNLEIAVKTDCRSVKEDNLGWYSVVEAIVKVEYQKLEDIFFNILDEIEFKPLSIEVLFDNEFDKIENEMFEQFKTEFKNIIAQKSFSDLKNRVDAITQLLNFETYEGYILNLFSTILEVIDEEEKVKEIVTIVAVKLGIEGVESNTSSEEEEEKKEIIQLDNEEKEAVAELLQEQLEILEIAKDEVVFDRTLFLVENVAKKLGLKVDSSIEDKNSLKNFIKTILKTQFGIEVEERKSSKNNKIDKKEETAPKSKLQPPPNRSETHKQSTPKVVKIEQSQIDELMDIVGELLVVKNALPYIASNMQQNNIEESKRELSSKYDEISRIIEQLRDRVMQMRLLPLEYIFGRYPKLVRDISKKLNKKIKYIEEGGETKLDKMVIEKLADPLVHIIRNSLDHGIEIPEERVAKGKSPEGILKISANSQGDKVFITIKDDGRGIDIDKVVTKALEKRLISVEMLDNMSEEEKLRLIFLPGLSTKDEITELSGRGVGTDAVKKTIEELGGRIYIKSLKGTGTEIKLELPLSVALTNVFHIKMANINYAIPMDFIVETVKVLDKEIQTANHKPFIKIRGELIPLLIEKELLGYEKLKGEVSVVIIKSNDEKIGFVVDTFVGQLDVVQKPLTGVISYHPFITGISLLGNGEILFILDIGKILTQ